jgi:hypothetical protein
VEKIEEILCMTYERKTRGPREGIEDNTPIHTSVSVEPINPCVTNTPRRIPPFRQQQEVHLHKGKQLVEQVQGALSKYTHRAEVVFQHSGWQDMIPPSYY